MGHDLISPLVRRQGVEDLKELRRRLLEPGYQLRTRRGTKTLGCVIEHFGHARHAQRLRERLLCAGEIEPLDVALGYITQVPPLVTNLPLGAGGWCLPRLVVRGVDQVVKPLPLLTNHLQQVVLSLGCKGVDARGPDFDAHAASSSCGTKPTPLGCTRLG